MAADFQIFFHRTADSLHLKLDGDFDGNSARKLHDALKEHGSGYWQIFIDTNDLKSVFSTDGIGFQQRLENFSQNFNNLIFLGENGHHMTLFS